MLAQSPDGHLVGAGQGENAHRQALGHHGEAQPGRDLNTRAAPQLWFEFNSGPYLVSVVWTGD